MHVYCSQDERTVEILESVMSCMVITDSSQAGCPVLFATKGFAETVGSHRDELLGKSVFQVDNKSPACRAVDKEPG